jgi:hypothetical protein
LECLPLFARDLAALPDHKRLLRELRLLERHTHTAAAETPSTTARTAPTITATPSAVLRDLSTHLSYLEALTRALAD